MTSHGMAEDRSLNAVSIRLSQNIATRHLNGKSPSSLFRILGPYRWVRHPLYLFMIVLFWSYPSLTADRLLFNILWTIWIVIGTILEERDLVDDFGDTYRDYQTNVPMLVPHSFLPAYPAGKSDKEHHFVKCVGLIQFFFSVSRWS